MSDTLMRTAVSDDTVISYTTPPLERVPYEVRCEAPQTHDWSFSQLYAEDTAARESFHSRLGCALARLNLRKVYAPTVRHMSGVVLPPEHFTLETHLPCGVSMKRPTQACDATSLQRLSGFAMSAGGCSLLVLSFVNTRGVEFCFGAHAGKMSLLDMPRVLTQEHSREHFSIVDALVSEGVALGGVPAEMTLRAFFSIPWEAFRHSTDDVKYGEVNFQIISFLESTYGSEVIKICDNFHEHLCLNEIIRVQAEQAGIGKIETSGLGLPLDGPFAYTQHSNPALSGLVRNLVTLVRL